MFVIVVNHICLEMIFLEETGFLLLSYDTLAGLCTANAVALHHAIQSLRFPGLHLPYSVAHVGESTLRKDCRLYPQYAILMPAAKMFSHFSMHYFVENLPGAFIAKYNLRETLTVGRRFSICHISRDSIADCTFYTRTTIHYLPRFHVAVIDIIAELAKHSAHHTLSGTDASRYSNQSFHPYSSLQ